MNQIIKSVEVTAEKTGMPISSVCRSLEVCPSTLGRWMRRKNKGMDPIDVPGPKKVEPVDPDELKKKVNALDHGKKRTRGAGILYEKVKDGVSRRELSETVEKARARHNKEKQAAQKRITWLCPGAVWSMDDTELGKTKQKVPINVHNMQDLSSQYKFNPLIGKIPEGKKVASNLRKSFIKYGAPLFIKMDGASNLNARDILHVCREFFVIPLKSPGYYSPYNGGIEHANREFKECLLEKIDPVRPNIETHLESYGVAAVHDLNHKSRRKLKRKTSCQEFFEGKNRFKYTKRQRREIYDWIIRKALDILKPVKNLTEKLIEKAYRKACEIWMETNGLIKIFNPETQKVLPIFSGDVAHK